MAHVTIFCGIIALVFVVAVSADFNCVDVSCAYCNYNSFVKKCGSYCAGPCKNKQSGTGTDQNAQNSVSGGSQPAASSSSGGGNSPATGTGGGATGGGGAQYAPPQDPNVPLTPDNTDPRAVERFMSCCQDFIVPDECLDMCIYNVNKTIIMDLCYPPGKKNCTLAMMNVYFYCASDGHDNTECCEKAGLLDEKNGFPQCRPFCSGLPELKVIEGAHYACLEDKQLSKIMRCNYNAVYPFLGEKKVIDITRH